jgi:cytochrome c oxidase assembly protein subunit 15
MQGAFGALTVTMRLYPAVVTAHLLGGMGLLALLAVQAQGCTRAPLPLPRRLLVGTLAVFVLSVVQVALGGWVSANYAVLACPDFPTCQGSWWPTVDFEQGFTLRRQLGATQDGAWLSFPALTAIHVAHRLGAGIVLAAIALLSWRLAQARRDQPALGTWPELLAGVALWQVATGLSTVVFGWPLIAAVAHTGGAAALLTLLSALMTRAWQARIAEPSARTARLRLGAAP